MNKIIKKMVLCVITVFSIFGIKALTTVVYAIERTDVDYTTSETTELDVKRWNFSNKKPTSNIQPTANDTLTGGIIFGGNGFRIHNAGYLRWDSGQILYIPVLDQDSSGNIAMTFYHNQSSRYVYLNTDIEANRFKSTNTINDQSIDFESEDLTKSGDNYYLKFTGAGGEVQVSTITVSVNKGVKEGDTPEETAENAISAIGVVSYSLNSLNAINTAQTAIDKCEGTSGISNYNIFTSALSTFNELESDAIQDFVTAVNNIGVVTQTSSPQINTAKEKYGILFGDTLTKTAVINAKSLLDTAEEEFGAFRSMSLPLNLSAFTGSQISSDKEITGTIFTARKGVTVETSNGTTISGIGSTGRVRTHGASFNSSSGERTLMFDAISTGTIIIYASTSSNGREIRLFKGNGNSADMNANNYLENVALTSGQVRKLEWTIAEVDTYQIGGGADIFIYYAEFIPAADPLVEAKVEATTTINTYLNGNASVDYSSINLAIIAGLRTDALTELDAATTVTEVTTLVTKFTNEVNKIPTLLQLKDGDLYYQTAGNAIRFIGLLLEEDYTDSEIKFVVTYNGVDADVPIITIFENITGSSEGIDITYNTGAFGANYLAALTLTDFSAKDYAFTIKLVINGEDCQAYSVTYIDGDFAVEAI